VSRAFRLLPAMLILATALPESASANDCACPTVRAFGKGNTSCSASESDGRCTIDFNLFDPRAEAVAANLLRSAGLEVVQPPPIPTVQALIEIGQRDPDLLADAVLVYLMVAAADQAIDTSADSSRGAQDVARLARPLRKQISSEFSPDTTQRWLATPDSQLGQTQPQVNSFSDNQVVLAPGCLEIRTDRFWAMFKASWSPLRVRPRCGRE